MSASRHHNALDPGYQLHWYRIEEVLGQGGFGITYLATDTNLDQKVAIKEFLPSDLAVRTRDSAVHPVSQERSDTFGWGLNRFLTEARTLAQFRHPNIVRVYSVFEANGTAYMVMEYEEGASLEDAFKFQRIHLERDILNVLYALMDGLALVHEAGFIHRDIKPDNVFLRDDGVPVLLDFGSARQALGAQTRTLTSLVTPGYAPFEQYNATRDSDKQGPWTDIYSLAASMYRGIIGQGPIDAVARADALLGGEKDPLIPATVLAPEGYSRTLLAAIDHALAFQPADRPQSLAEWARELPTRPTQPGGGVDRDAATTLDDEAPTVVRPETAQATEIITHPDEPPAPEVPATQSRSRIGYAAFLIVALLLTGIVAWRIFDETRPDQRVGDPARVEVEPRAPITTTQRPEPTAPSAPTVTDTDRSTTNSADVNQQQRTLDEQRRALEEERKALELERTRLALEAERKAMEAARREAEAQAKRLAEEQQRLADERARAEAEAEAKRIAEEQQRLADERARAEAEAKRIAEERDRLAAERARAEAEAAARAAQAREAEAARIASTRVDQSPSTATADEARIDALIASAESDIARLRLTSPPDDNAYQKLREVIRLDPTNARAADGLERIVERYLALADRAVQRADLAAADRFLDRADTVQPGHPEIAPRRERVALAKARAESDAERAASERAEEAAAREAAEREAAERRAADEATTRAAEKAAEQAEAERLAALRLQQRKLEQEKQAAAARQAEQSQIRVGIFPNETIVACYHTVGFRIADGAREVAGRRSGVDVIFDYYAPGTDTSAVGKTVGMWSADAVDKRPRMSSVSQSARALGLDAVLMGWYDCSDSQHFTEDTYSIALYLVDVTNQKLYRANAPLLDTGRAVAAVMAGMFKARGLK